MKFISLSMTFRKNVQLSDQGEQEVMQTSESSDRTDRIAGMVDDVLRENDLTLKQHKAFKRGCLSLRTMPM